MTGIETDPRVARSRTRMLTAATELMVEGGVRAVTVDAVAERSGVAKSTLYRHWASVHELLVDVMRANVPDTSPLDPSLGFEAAVRWWVGHAVDALSAPDWARTLPALLELRNHSAEMAALLASDFDEKLVTVSAILDLGVAEGRVPTGLAARQVMNTLVGPLVLATLNGEDDQLPALADYVAERFLASYGSQGATTA